MSEAAPMSTDAAPVDFDLEAYIGNYSGHTRIDRCMFIANAAADTPLELEALQLAADAVKQSDNFKRYEEVMKKINGRLGPNYVYDQSWMDRKQAEFDRKQRELLGNLQVAKMNFYKESMHSAQHELGEFYYRHGDLSNALKAYMKSREYSTKQAQVKALCRAIIRICIETKQHLVYLATYVNKAETSLTPEDSAADKAAIMAASGLEALLANNYKRAAKRFTEVGDELQDSFNNVIAPHDVAVYGALCSLAKFNRHELAQHVVNNVAFREFLELVPQMREVVNDFYNARYASCLNALDRMRGALQLDMHLQPHLPSLLNAIRIRALIQYAAPYSSLRLANMASAFNTDVSGLQKELAKLIAGGEVHARIDSHGAVLHARQSDARSTTWRQVLEAGDKFVASSKSLLLRASLLQHSFVVSPPAEAPSPQSDIVSELAPGVPPVITPGSSSFLDRAFND